MTENERFERNREDPAVIQAVERAVYELRSLPQDQVRHAAIMVAMRFDGLDGLRTTLGRSPKK